MLWILPSSFVAGQSPIFSIHDFESRLSKDLIKDITLDQLGYVWTATDLGLVRFDGQSAIFYGGMIPEGFVKSLLRIEEGKLLALHDNGLTELTCRPDTVLAKQIIDGRSEDFDDALYYPKTIYKSKDGQIWIGENRSIVRFNNGIQKKYRFENIRDLGVITRSFLFVESSDQTLWVLSHGGQLYYYDELADEFKSHRMTELIHEASSMVAVGEDRVWVGGEKGLFELTLRKEVQPTAVKQLGGPLSISELALHDDVLLIGTWLDGLYYMQLEESLMFHKVQALPFDEIHGISFDEHNGWWVTGQEHTVLLKSVLFKSFNLNADNAVSITSINQNAAGNLLIIGDENVRNRQEIYEISDRQIKWQLGLTPVPFQNIPLAAYDDGTNIWTGDLGGGVYYTSKKTRQTVKLESIVNCNSDISMILEDHQDNIWVAGNTIHGLIKINPDKELEFYKNIGLVHSNVLLLLEDGTLLAGGKGTENYLYKFDTDKNLFENISLPINIQKKEAFEINDMTALSSKEIFIGSNDGVYVYHLQDKKIAKFSTNRLLMEEPVHAIAYAKDGTLWASTSSGLVSNKSTHSFVFDKSSGLPANTITDKGLLIDKEERLWVGTAAGLAMFERQNTELLKTPQPIIERVKLNNQTVKYISDELIQVPYHQGLELDFVTLSFPADQVVYSYRILERDTNWSSPNKFKQWFVSGLPPGTYTVQLRAQQKEGNNWSQPTIVRFQVTQPWYQKSWVIGLFVFGITGLLFLMTRWYNLRLIRQKNKLKSLVEKRTAEINRQKNEIIEQQKQLLLQGEKVQRLKDDQYKNDLKYKNKQLTTYTLNLIQKNQSLKELRLKINQFIRSSSKGSYQEMRKLINLIDYSFRKDEEWDNFKLYFEEVHVGFFEKLIKRHPKLTPHDLRHCALIRLNLTIEEMSTIIGISADSIKTARFRLKKKMGFDSKTDLFEYLMSV